MGNLGKTKIADIHFLGTRGSKSNRELNANTDNKPSTTKAIFHGLLTVYSRNCKRNSRNEETGITVFQKHFLLLIPGYDLTDKKIMKLLSRRLLKLLDCLFKGKSNPAA